MEMIVGANGDFVRLDSEEFSFIENGIRDLQIIFHPEIAPCGIIDKNLFRKWSYEKPFWLILDRNILSSLLKFCKNGALKNKEESQIIGLIMIWTYINGISLTAGPAIQEMATKAKSQNEALKELQEFREIIDYYPAQTWLDVALGRETEIAPIVFTEKSASDISVDYSAGNDHYYMAVASMIHATILYRDKSLKPVEKILRFSEWMLDNLLSSDYILAYLIMLYTGQENVKAPKGANSEDFDKIISGCENQAWDISYLTIWSTLYYEPQKYDMHFLFATNDTLLKRIFINKHGEYGVNGLLCKTLSQKDYNLVCDYWEERQKTRKKPNFGDNPQVYFNNLIESEKKLLREKMGLSI